MQNIRIICVGKLKDVFFADAGNEYMKRLAGYCKPEVVEVPEYRLPDNPSEAEVEIALEKEGAAIRAKTPAGAKTIALCIEGSEHDSQGLSELLTDSALRGASRLCFVVGGSYGLHESIKKGADIMLSMSKMTFPHSLARVMLLEQLYRAFKIAEGGKYHK